MSNQPDYNDTHMAEAVRDIFSALDERQVRRRRPYWAFAVVVAVLGVLGGVLWYAYPKEVAQREIDAAPIIRAAAAPIKVIPEEPGGMNVAFRDSTVFNALEGNGTDKDTKRIENILGDEGLDAGDSPDKDKVFSSLKTDIRIEGKKVASIGSGGKTVPEEPEEPEDSKTAGEDVDASGATDSPVEEKTAGAAARPERERAADDARAEQLNRTQPAAGVEVDAREQGGFYVQLASLRSADDAEKAWLSLKGQFYQYIGQVQHRIQKADLGDRGIYFRVQAGPLQEPKARDICSAIQAKKPGGCLVISR